MRQLGNIRKISQLVEREPGLPSRSNFLGIAACSNYEPCIKNSTGDNSRHIPIYTLAQKPCEDNCNTILTIHALSQYAMQPVKLGQKQLFLNYHLRASLG